MTHTDEFMLRIFLIVFLIFAGVVLAVLTCWAFLKVVAVSIEALSDVLWDVKHAWMEATGAYYKKEDKAE